MALQVYTKSLLVPLAAPDFSMPYNVICLSSTVLAVYFGAVLNILLKRPNEASATEAVTPQHSRRSKMIKLAKLVVLVGGAFGAVVYLDEEVREQVSGLLSQIRR
jgi:GPI-anchor transamidase subunit T